LRFAKKEDQPIFEDASREANAVEATAQTVAPAGFVGKGTVQKYRSILPRNRNTKTARSRLLCALCSALLAITSLAVPGAEREAQSSIESKSDRAPQSVIIDTDIGGDIDDVYAVGLALQSPELRVLGIMTEFVNTTLEARLTSRFLKETGHPDIPVAVGMPKQVPPSSPLNEARYAERGPVGLTYPNAVDFLLQQIRLHPNEITLIAIGPETNIGAAIDRDVTTFLKLKRVVVMGGSVYRGYNPKNTYFINKSPSLEYNIAMDPAAAQKLFTSGIPLYVLPTDSTQIKLEELRRGEIFSAGTPMTDAITLLTEEWSHGLQATPTLNDAVAVAYALDPHLCPMIPMNLLVDAVGATKVAHGAPNAQVCLQSDSDQFFDFVMPRILGPTRPQADH
jgi:inosine-uridine nucleoside N-ribohydrolase